MEIYQEFTLLLLIAVVVGYFSMLLRQPLLIAYLAVGIIVGPSILGIVSAHTQIDLLAHWGITILLFVVGLKLDLRIVRSLGPVALATGLGQLAFTILIGFGLTLLLGFSPIDALYIAIALTFSSTIIIVKLLSDKGELESLHGRIAMGFLIVQDIAVVLAMLGLNLTIPTADDQLIPPLQGLGISVVFMVVVLPLLMRYVIPGLMRSLARSVEMLMLFAIAWGTMLAAGADILGLSKEVGAFIAGFSLANTAVKDVITSRLTSLRDFLLLFFFIYMGEQLNLSLIGDNLFPALVLSLFVLIGNPLIVMAIMGGMGYRRRTGFKAGLTVAQISEFSIIFITMGLGLGHIGDNVLGVVTLVGIVTITTSTYMILYSEQLFERVRGWLSPFERTLTYRELDDYTQGQAAPIIIIGLGRLGRRIAGQLIERGEDVIGVDIDPGRVERAQTEGIHAVFGDAEDIEFLSHLPVHTAKWVVSTLPRREVNEILMQGLALFARSGRIAIASFREDDEINWKNRNVDLILHPYREAAEQAVAQITP
ncbi:MULTISPECIES: cation:proton antiporter [Halomonadaceae]|uniref:Sodium:proton exchanger n=1 Tax=Vreelandella halophila TaxID=86177 RepID=A0A9X5B4W9_9GAMM|nr:MULTISPECIES: cation:proton antiporter family protein [Halomonas]MYL26770.1 sodium:proton exchanger [Halomonas utahensis]MYL74031.1 sodium:proton exchanger [Halomonas sp. 22501_18_FS]